MTASAFRWGAAFLCALIAGAAGGATPGIDLAPLEPILKPGTVLLLGELHGTAEAPAFVSRVAALALRMGRSVKVGLEIPRSESSRVNAFLASAGEAVDREAMLAGPFWQSSYQDGRASEAMAKLIDDLRQHVAAGLPLSVVLFDVAGGRSRFREQSMAEALAAAAAAAPRDVTVVLTGNLHARLARGGMRGVGDPMGARIAGLLPDRRLVALELSHAGGTAWVCTSGRPGCGVIESPGRGRGEQPHVTVSKAATRVAYQGTFHVGEIHASLPAAARRTEPPPLASAQPTDAAALEMPLSSVPSPPLRLPLRAVGQWPRWMGPRGDGALEVGLLRQGTEVSLEVEWRRPTGRGYSSLTVFGNRLLTLEADRGELWAVALDVDDARTVWRASLTDPEVPTDERLNEPLSTLATDGERVFVTHPAGRVFALSFADGAVLWSRDLVKEFHAALPSYGMSTSPVLYGDRLFVLLGGRQGKNLIAFDPATGKVLKTSGHAGQGAYATPVPGTVAGEAGLVVPAGDSLYAVSPRGDRLLWSHKGLSYPDRDPLLLPEGRVFVALQEYGAMLEVSAETAEVRELWRSEALRNSYSPAVHHQGAIYGFGGPNLLCLDVETGRTLWSRRLGDGSLVRVDDQLVIHGTMNGWLRLVEASPGGYKETAALLVFPSGGSGPTPPSFGAGRIFLRGANEIVAVRVEV